MASPVYHQKILDPSILRACRRPENYFYVEGMRPDYKTCNDYKKSPLICQMRRKSDLKLAGVLESFKKTFDLIVVARSYHLKPLVCLADPNSQKIERFSGDRPYYLIHLQYHLLHLYYATKAIKERLEQARNTSYCDFATFIQKLAAFFNDFIYGTKSQVVTRFAHLTNCAKNTQTLIEHMEKEVSFFERWEAEFAEEKERATSVSDQELLAELKREIGNYLYFSKNPAQLPTGRSLESSQVLFKSRSFVATKHTCESEEEMSYHLKPLLALGYCGRKLLDRIASLREGGEPTRVGLIWNQFQNALRSFLGYDVLPYQAQERLERRRSLEGAILNTLVTYGDQVQSLELDGDEDLFWGRYAYVGCFVGLLHDVHPDAYIYKNLRDRLYFMYNTYDAE